MVWMSYFRLAQHHRFNPADSDAATMVTPDVDDAEKRMNQQHKLSNGELDVSARNHQLIKIASGSAQNFNLI